MAAFTIIAVVSVVWTYRLRPYRVEGARLAKICIALAAALPVYLFLRVGSFAAETGRAALSVGAFLFMLWILRFATTGEIGAGKAALESAYRRLRVAGARGGRLRCASCSYRPGNAGLRSPARSCGNIICSGASRGARKSRTCSFPGPGSTAPAAEFQFCRKTVAVPPPRRYTPVGIARGIFGRWPLPVVNYASREMRAALEALIAREAFDAAHFDSIHMAAYAALLPEGIPILYDWHNIESELMRRYGAHAGGLRSIYAAMTARRLAALEKQILRQAFGHIVCSQRELEELRRVAPGARIAVVENGVDTGYFKPCGSAGERWRILFVGSMGYHANAQAAVWFARHAWPAVRERFPALAAHAGRVGPGARGAGLARRKECRGHRHGRRICGLTIAKPWPRWSLCAPAEGRG